MLSADKPQAGDQSGTMSGTDQGSTATSAQQTTPPPSPTPPDRATPRIGIIALGIVAPLCVVALIYLSGRPEAPGTDTQPAEADEPQATEPGPVAVEAANDTGALGLLGQIAGVLGTIAAAAIGGIAGFFTAARRTGTAEQQPLGGTR